MKSTIIFLGLVALSFTNVNAANEFKSQDLDQQDFATLTVANAQQSQSAFVNQDYSNTEVRNGSETEVFNPSSVVATTYVKTIDEVIAESKQITESKEEAFQPLSLDYTVEDRIAENNEIIESTVSNETFPLDFEKINSTMKSVKNNTAIKMADLKL